jgi:transcriptional regulator with XRE-family HTH domain
MQKKGDRSMSEETPKKASQKEKIISPFSQWLDEQLMHGEATHLAEMLRVAVSTVTHWRQGRNTPTAAHCAEIADYFKVDKSLVEKMVREARLIRHRRKIERRRQYEQSTLTMSAGSEGEEPASEA